MPCAKLPLCSSRNRLSRVPLSVKRTVPPQLSAVASLPLPIATAAASSSTAVPGERDERRGFPRRSAPRNDNTRGLLPSVIANHPRCSCHCEPVLTLARQSVLPAPAAEPLFYVLPPAGYFCLQRQKYPKTPLETTFQDFLSALRHVPNPPYVPRVIAVSVCRCRSKGLCHHSFPLPLRCRCLLPR